MFKFNFNSENEEIVKEDLEKDKKLQSEQCKESEKISISSNQYQEIAENVKNSTLNVFISNENEIGYLDNTLLTDKSDTDLIPRVYEGGFKIWECTQDLADFITNPLVSEFAHPSGLNVPNLNDSEFKNKSVCDLGCSAGVLGIIALMIGAKHVDFQDYVSLYF